MAKCFSTKWRFAAGSFAGISIFAVGAFYVVGTGGTTIVVVLGFLWLVWRLDNATGAFLPLAVLFLIVLAVLAFLVSALAFVHRLTTRVSRSTLHNID